MHCCFHFFLSYLFHFHLSPNRARELEATCCSISVQQLLEVCRHILNTSLLSVMSLPSLSLITALLCKSLPSSSSIPCHLEYHLFPTIFVKLFGTVLPPYSSVLCPPPSWLPSSWPYRCLKPVDCSSPLSPNAFYHLPCFPLLPTAFATSSVHHPWFLLLGVPSPRLAPHTYSLPSPCTPPSYHPCTSST